MLKKIDKVVEHINHGRLNQAYELITKILINNYENFDALYLKGIVCGLLSRHSECLKYLLRAEKINPNHPYLHFNIANALTMNGEDEQALKHHKLTIKFLPKYADAWLNYGKSLLNLNSLEDSLESFQIAIKLKKDYSEAYFFSGIVMSELKRWEESLENFKKALELNPSNVEVYIRIGKINLILNNLNESLQNYNKLIEINSSNYLNYFYKAIVLEKLNIYEEAIINYKIAIDLNPQCIEAYSNLGNIYYKLGLTEDALKSINIAVNLNPESEIAFNNRGFIHHNCLRIDDAISDYDIAIRIKHEYVEAHKNKAISLLLSGDLLNGFREYEWRIKSNENIYTKKYDGEYWTGQIPLQGKKILIYSEQGLGDTIQFSRYLKLVKNKGAYIIFEVPKELILLLEFLDCVDEFVERGDNLPDIDMYCPLMSLPHIFNTSLNTIPPQISIKAKKVKLEKWNKILGKKNKPRIGLAWSGNIEHKDDFKRSIELKELVKYLNYDYDYISLLKEIRRYDEEVINESGIKDFKYEINDFSDTVALCELMDIIICVDTSVAHLAGSMSKMTWLLLPYVPDWRWLLNRDDSPWYSTVKLYRQKEDRKYSSILKIIFEDLKSNIANSL